MHILLRRIAWFFALAGLIALLQAFGHFAQRPPLGLLE